MQNPLLKLPVYSLLYALIPLLLTACGGGGGGSSSDDVQESLSSSASRAFIAAETFTGAGQSDPSELTEVGGRLYFAANHTANRRDVWVISSRDSAPIRLTNSASYDAFGAVISDLTPVGSNVFFTLFDGTPQTPALWVTDGTLSGTMQLQTINASELTAGLGRLFFDGNSDPWTSDGMTTSRVANLGGSSQGFVTVNGQVVFANGRDVYATDGASVSNLTNGSVEAPRRLSTGIGQAFFFATNSVDASLELWVTDGTVAGTTVVRGFDDNCTTDDQAVANGILFFCADVGAAGEELWVSDGTLAGTQQVDIHVGVNDSSPQGFTAFAGQVYFSAFGDAATGRELWRSNGTEAGTILVLDIWPGPRSSEPERLSNVESHLAFRANDGGVESMAWISDGTASGTIKVVGACDPYSFIRVGGLVYFSGEDCIRNEQELMAFELD